MGTSKSNRRENWVAGAHIYSGRPDPIWRVKATVVQKLARYWATMEPHEGSFPSPVGLGYRGCFLKGPGRQWLVYRNSVMLKKADGCEVRLDRECRFEKTLLASAPEQLLPHLLNRDG